MTAGTGAATAGTDSVAITGIGMLTPVGQGAAAVFDAVCTGRSGLAGPPVDHPVAGSIEVAGMIAAADGELDPSRIGSGPELNTLDRTIVLAILTARQALADAGVVVGRDVDPCRIGVIVGGVGGMATLEKQVLQRSLRGRVAVSPYLLTGILPNMPAARIAIEHGIRGYSTSVGTACASGAQAIADGVRLIRCGELDMVLCGASEAPLFPTFAETFGNARALARGWDDPADASRPFDRRRNGFVLAEGAALLVLERSGHAAARGASGYADVLGYGSTSDAHHPTIPRPDGTGAADCIGMAISRAGLQPSDVGYLNAHGTSTKLGDLAEATAIGLAFGSQQPAVSSTKALTGHMLGTSGVVEAAISALALSTGLLPPTYNLDDPDPACELDHICKQPRQAAIRHALSNSFGFGGHNVSLLFGSSDLPTREPPAATEVPAPASATDRERGISS
jgi:3-oxoacyl-[acyl-carrier-protein] synthase II